MDKFNSTTDIVKDILSHQDNDTEYLEKLFKKTGISNEEIGTLRSAFQVITNDPSLNQKKKIDLMTNSWKINYTQRPPDSIAEFLTSKYIGPTAESIRPYLKEHLIEFWSPEQQYRDWLLAPFIGWGKTFASTLSALYLSTHLYYMRNPKKYFGLSASTVLCILFISFSINKVKELIVEPFTNIMDSTDLFEKCRTLEQLDRKVKGGENKIFYTTAGDTNVLTLGPNVNIKISSDPSNLLGLSIIFSVISELHFFTEKLGKSPEFCKGIYDGTKERVYSRMQGNYWGRTILDSSPNDIETPLEKYIWEEAGKIPTNFVTTGSQWKFQPHLFSKKTFPIFKGSSGKQPRIITENERILFDNVDIIDVPIDIKVFFDNDLPRALKNLAGVPSGGTNKLITNKELIEDIFTPNLKNMYSYIEAPAEMPPESLIWELIKDDFFVKLGNGKYQFYNHPQAERYIGIDQSYRTDVTGISMIHVEKNLKGELLYIVDFTLAIIPGKTKINLDAVKMLVHELKRYGNINLKNVTFDQFQSEPAKQYLSRHGFDIHGISADRTLSPYMSFLAKINQRRVKSGRNIFLKNNLKSLILAKRASGSSKIEHLEGDLNLDTSNLEWESSMLGYYAKDVSDSLIVAIELADQLGATSDIVWTEGKTEELGTQMEDALKRLGLRVV